MGRSRDDLWVVTCYFNPNGYRTKRENYRHFREGLKRIGAPCLVVECACEGAAFELPAGDETIRVRSSDVIWQKERLLNLAIAALPQTCRKVAWLDCDLLFEDPAWHALTCEALDVLPVVQPFTTAVRLPRRGQTEHDGEAPECPSFGAVHSVAPQAVLSGDFHEHGHTGFAWAGRMDWIQAHGLFDTCISGSGDHLMAHAFCGDFSSHCVENMVGSTPSAYRRAFEEWGRGVHAVIGGRVGAVPGRVLHLWHGDENERHYYRRNQQLAELDFDPARDLRLGAEGVWEWATPRDKLHHWARALFTLRNEDAAFTFVAHEPRAAPRLIHSPSAVRRRD